MTTPTLSESLISASEKTAKLYRTFLGNQFFLAEDEQYKLVPTDIVYKQSFFLVVFIEASKFFKTNLSLRQIEILSISAYARFRAVVNLDSVLDDMEFNRRISRVKYFELHYEAAVLAFAQSNLHSKVLTGYTFRLNEIYLRTLASEKDLKPSVISLMRNLFRKSSMVLLPFKWAMFCGINLSAISIRAATMKLFVALQLLDDIIDLESDISKGQNTLLRTQLDAVAIINDNGEFILNAESLEVIRKHLSWAKARALSAAEIYRRIGSELLSECAELTLCYINNFSIETYFNSGRSS